MTYTYTYDAANQLTAIQIPGTGSITYSSYTWNRPASITLPGGSKKDYVYDPLMRIKQITAKDPAQNLLMNYQYTYDKMDNIKTKGTEHGDYQYGYDDLYRLTSADNPVQNDEAYTYDSVGNRLTSEGVGGTWSYNQNNELQNYNGLTFSYDQNGSTIQKNDNGTITNYIYNTEDRLTEVRDGSNGLIASYYYDPFGRRLWKDVGGARTYFLYADEGLIGEYDSSGIELKAYGYVPDSTWTTDPLFMKEGGNYFFYHNDHLGTPHKLTATNGAVAWQANYSSFGEATVDDSSTITNNLRFPGQYYDSETQLHYNYHRYYDPRIGRYLRKDPITDTLVFLNPFIYANANPICKIDAYGLLTIDGMDCTEKSRKVIPTISSGRPIHSYNAGTRVICTRVVIEDTLSCVCIGYREQRIADLYQRYRTYEVKYICCAKGECNKENCKEVTRIEEDEPTIEIRYRYERLPEMVIKHGTPTAAFGACSECLMGVGFPM